MTTWPALRARREAIAQFRRVAAYFTGRPTWQRRAARAYKARLRQLEER